MDATSFTPAAAVEDSNLFLLAWDAFVRDLYFPLAEPFAPLPFRIYDSDIPLEFLTRFLAAGNLANHPNLVAIFPSVLESIYRYASGGEPQERHFHIFNAILENFTYLAGPTFVFRAGKKPSNRVEIENKLLSENVSPRFALAVRFYKARNNFELYFSRSLATGDMDAYTISAPAVSLLSGLSYTYIIKLIKAKKIPARKENGVWQISAVEAAKFFEERKETPGWLKKYIAGDKQKRPG